MTLSSISKNSAKENNEPRSDNRHDRTRISESAQTPRIWRLNDTPISRSKGNTALSGSLQTLAALGSTSTLKPPGGGGRGAGGGSSIEPLPASPSQLSIEKAITQKFASLGIQQHAPWRVKMDQFVQNEGSRVLFLFFWSLLQLLIFLFSFEIYNASTHYSQARATLGLTLGISRGAAAVINLDCGLILFSVCRNLISMLRSTFLNDIIPFDKNIMFHKTIAWSIVVFSVVHGISHYVNYHRIEQQYVQAQDKAPVSARAMALLTGPGFTGHVLVFLLFLMVTSSTERVRRKGFETFWYTHHLFALFFITLMYHGAFCFIRADTPPYCKSSPGSYKFVLTSLLFYILERTAREIRARKPTSITKIVLHPSKVVEVQIKKENKNGDSCIRAKAGQYVFLNCPDISIFEWHPFTITSAPEEDYVSVHIRIVGDWTTAFAKRLGCSFDDEQQFWIEELVGSRINNSNSSLDDHRGFVKTEDSDVSPTISTFKKNMEVMMTLPRVLIDGPYGSPSEDAFNYEIAVLVGAGIGVTPFASVLKHIWYSVMQPTKVITLRKVYFFWVCRDRDAFEWFQDLLIALEEQNLTDFLEIRSYLTGELGSEELNTVLMEARATAAAHAARLMRRKERRETRSSLEERIESNLSNDSLSARDRDVITGLRSPTYYGRPNFDKIFGEVALAHPREQGQVGVFFCGPKPLGKTLNRCARKYKFKFHKENF
ncbi:hypothetical protein BGX28_002186 [Mortierella sp. GBA30]|nr:hypothetical protein BGX28_002186 [Mortierella sp. GBA30]